MRHGRHAYLYKMPNKLIKEQSPYLLQHAHNPVDWYPWCEEAFEDARQQNKPVLVSIGYAACHWCHVMEKESFENEEVAGYMNGHFICIKVDREEHPDVDHLYMDALQAMSGSGGWPLNVFVNHKKEPFYGGTYFPPRPAYSRPSWIQVLEWISKLWTEQADEVAGQAAQMIAHLRQASQMGLTSPVKAWDMATCREMAETLLKQADTVYGGFGNAPKFPGTMAISFLLEHYYFTGFEPALKQALLSLDAMIAGGIYDQLGGGFARYSTDAKWLAPHFEKMLYDNALIISSLCDAYMITKEERYIIIIEETIAFIERELKDATGGYYSALDADSEGEEGKFYTWTWQEWCAVAGSDNVMLAEYFGVNEKGNWEHTNILHEAVNVSELGAKYNIQEDELKERIRELKKKLFAVRAKRERPITDDKSLLSWNALMNSALSKAGIALENEVYLNRASEHMDWMLNNFDKAGALLHTWKGGLARISANLDDKAYLVQALLQLAANTADNKWVLKAHEITEEILQNFLHENGDFFYYTSVHQKDIPVRKVDVYDGATPSANAVMAGNLMILGLCMERSDLHEQAFSMLQKTQEKASRYTYSFGHWATLLQRYAANMKIVVCSGPDSRGKAQELQKNLLPQSYILTSEKEISDLPILKNKFLKGQTRTFVCTQEACLAPESDAERVLQLIKQ